MTKLTHKLQPILSVVCSYTQKSYLCKISTIYENKIFTHHHLHTGALLRILGPLDSIFTRGGGAAMAGDTKAIAFPSPSFFPPSPKSDYTVSAIKIVQFCM